MRRVVLLTALPVAAAVLAAAGACSSGSNNTSASGGPSASSGSSNASIVIAKAQAVVDQAMQPTTVSTSAVSKVQVPPGKTIGVLVCAFDNANCGGVEESSVRAALSAAGYKAIFVDGQDTPQGQADGEEQLVADHVNAIINVSVADAVIQSSVRAAREANIPVFCMGCGNSITPIADPEKYGSIANVDSNTVAEGIDIGNYMIVQQKGRPMAAIMTVPSAGPVVGRVQGVEEALATCENVGCKYYTQALSVDGDVEGNARQLTDAFLAQYPAGELNYIVTPSDSVGAGVEQALATSGRDDVIMAGYDCYPADLAWIRQGKYQDADLVVPLAEEGWVIVDGVIRYLAGQPVHNTVLPARLITSANVGTGTSVCGTVAQYAAPYEAAWIK
jgi:ribose transport system substrate-binding protein